MRTASVPYVESRGSGRGGFYEGTYDSMLHLVHEVAADPGYRAICGIGFLSVEFHAAPQLVTCLWCLAQRSYTL